MDRHQMKMTSLPASANLRHQAKAARRRGFTGGLVFWAAALAFATGAAAAGATALVLNRHVPQEGAPTASGASVAVASDSVPSNPSHDFSPVSLLGQNQTDASGSGYLAAHVSLTADSERYRYAVTGTASDSVISMGETSQLTALPGSSFTAGH